MGAQQASVSASLTYLPFTTWKMADQSSSSSGAESSVAVVPQEVNKIVFDEAEVKALRQQGVDAEKADNWGDAAELYSRALEKAYV